jgi:hypothetical protein
MDRGSTESDRCDGREVDGVDASANMLGSDGIGTEDHAVGQDQDAGNGDSVAWRHSEEIAGRAFADEVLLTARRDLIGELFRKGFLDRLRERLGDDK